MPKKFDISKSTTVEMSGKSDLNHTAGKCRVSCLLKRKTQLEVTKSIGIKENGRAHNKVKHTGEDKTKRPKMDDHGNER